MSHRRSLALCLSLALLLAVVATAGAEPPKDPLGTVTIKKGQPVHIAYWLVVAGSDASLGIDIRRGVEIAIQDKGGKLLGHPIKLSGQDDGLQRRGRPGRRHQARGRPDDRGRRRPDLLERRPPRGPHPLEGRGSATVSASNTAPYLTDPKRGNEYNGYLRTAHNDKVQGAVAAQFAIKKLGVKTAATIHDGSVYAEQLQAVFAEEFKKLGGTIVAQEAVAPTDTDMRPVLTKIATGKPEFIYFPIFIAAGGHITRQAKEVSGLEKVYLMSADGTFSPDFYKAAGEAAVGMYHSSPDFSAFSAGYKDFLAKHQKKYGEKPLAPYPRPRLRRGHDDLRGRRERSA